METDCDLHYRGKFSNNFEDLVALPQDFHFPMIHW